ncbi:hypothetical protein KUTeg_010799 [Tegillarca granosa]|uniref:Alpha-1,3-mannosyl-glycoprotein 2-beta-N-acetylglucosaminyltransferase n=1 Tax=Tegillarca granosa TaxID=220873 RepID=A0ABQ9F288_TEGGR|nr:hypothetical protein KUTeg_010799 [Tegillarca granosa]
MRRKHIVSVIILVFLSWNILMYYVLVAKNPSGKKDIEEQLDQNSGILQQLRVLKKESDDLDISPDFFEYFSATYNILKSDSTLWCVSAWNDNGKTAFVEDEPELLYRTDFFPGLGWMMEKKTWDELGPKWPETFWDDWMRHDDQRKGRVCIRPEICRTSTFGKKGAGVPRTAYNGIVSFIYQGQRVYLAPPKDWKGYDSKWV